MSRQALDMPGNNVHDYVAASATFLGLVYPGRGLEHSIRKEHMDNMTSEDYRKVWRVSTAPTCSWTTCMLARKGCTLHQQCMPDHARGAAISTGIENFMGAPTHAAGVG